jgi:hypothetical protein
MKSEICLKQLEIPYKFKTLKSAFVLLSGVFRANPKHDPKHDDQKLGSISPCFQIKKRFAEWAKPLKRNGTVFLNTLLQTLLDYVRGVKGGSRGYSQSVNLFYVPIWHADPVPVRQITPSVQLCNGGKFKESTPR